MFKLINYGMRERLKLYLALFIILFSLFAIIGFANLSGNYDSINVDAAINGLFWLTISAVLIGNIFFMGNDFYGRQGKLIFSIPIKSHSMVASRVILFLIDFIYVFLLNYVTSLMARPFYVGLNLDALGDSGYWYYNFISKVNILLVLIMIPIIVYFMAAFCRCVLKIKAASAVVVSSVITALFTSVLVYMIRFLQVTFTTSVYYSNGTEVHKFRIDHLPNYIIIVAIVLVIMAGLTAATARIISRKLNI